MDTAQLLGEAPQVKLKWPDPEAISADRIWGDYDPEMDRLILYVTGEPVRGVAHYVEDNLLAIFDPATNEVVGVEFEQWEHKHLPALPPLQQTWPVARQSLVAGLDWSQAVEVVIKFILIQLTMQNRDANQAEYNVQPTPG